MKTPIVGIHLDMKYFMPRRPYLLEYVRRLPEAGVNTLLLEYEDKFPFEKYPFLRDPEAWTASELKKFLAAARGAGVQVVPLVQTLSHLEFALAHRELAHLREMPDIETQICPCKPEAVAFVRDLIDEVMAWHEDTELFHVGADEAWFLSACPKCAKKTGGGKDKLALWLTHTRAICKYVMKKGKRPMVWDDSFWHDPEKSSELPPQVILCPWHYGITQVEQCNKSMVPHMEAYRRHGHESVAIPCCNWGHIFMRKESLANTAALAQAARGQKALGLINSAWTCFHLPLPAFQIGVEATGAAMAGRDPTALEWQEGFLAREFGARVPGLAGHLHTLGELWEIGIEGLGRPVSPMIWGYMDMVVHCKGGQLERQKRGIYPLDWGEVDFDALYLRKIEMVKALPEEKRRGIEARLDDYLKRYAEAEAAVKKLCRAARSHRDAAELFAALAGMKLQAARALSFFLRGDQDKAAVRPAFRAAGKAAEKALAAFYEPLTVRRMMAMWRDPIDSALGKKQ